MLPAEASAGSGCWDTMIRWTCWYSGTALFYSLPSVLLTLTSVHAMRHIVIGRSINEVAGGKPTGWILNMEILPATLTLLWFSEPLTPSTMDIELGHLCTSLLSHLCKWLMLSIYRQSIPAYLTITNWRLLWSLHMKPPRILGAHYKKLEKSYKFSQKSETSSHH